MRERRAKIDPSRLGASWRRSRQRWRWSWNWRRSEYEDEEEEAEGDGFRWHSDRLRIRGTQALFAPDLDAIRSPISSTVSISIFFFLTIYLFNSVLNLKKWLCRLEEATGLTFRFVIGKTNDKSKMLELKKEVAEYDDFLLLDIEEEYSKLPYKTYVAALSAHNKYIFCF